MTATVVRSMYQDGRLPLDRRRVVSSRLWLGSILFFGVGDLLTTAIGLATVGVFELNSVAASLDQQFGFVAMVALKFGILAGCYLLWQVMPRPHRDGIPLGLASLGVLVTAWNLHVLMVALVL